MSFGTIPVGSTLTRVYYAVPEHHTIGTEFDDFASAARHAQRKLAALIESLRTESGFSLEQATETANVQVCVDLRWVMAHPGGGSTDMSVERLRDVARLRPDLAEAAAR